MARKVTKEQRAARQRQQQRMAKPRRQREWGRRMAGQVGGGVVVLALVIGAFVYFSHSGASNSPAIAASSSLGPIAASQPTEAIGNFHKVSAPLRQGQKPLLLFIGAQYCPFCGAERWAVVKALSRFGTWSNLGIGHSTSGTGGFGNVPTFVLLHAHYRSPYVAFDSKDVADNAGNTLQTLSPQEQALFNRYDTSGSIPLVYVDGYAMTGSGYSPAELQGRSFAAVQQALHANSSGNYVADINGEANLLTAFLCQADGNRPGRACDAPIIRTIEGGIH